jgi:uncharacterized protein
MSNWLNALAGGVLIGTSATILLAFNGRIAGISGILNNAIESRLDSLSERLRQRVWSLLFLAGMLGGGAIYAYILAPGSIPQAEFTPWIMLGGGLLVGVGTRMGNGCTSGHGVCGLGRLSFRSLVAVITFLVTAMITVFVTRHLLK